MDEPIWTPARRRIVVLATLFGIAFADGMLVIVRLVRSFLWSQPGPSYDLLTGWIELLDGLLFLPSIALGVQNNYLANAILGAIAGAIIGLFASEFATGNQPGSDA
jgi:hypothetical protein